MAYDRDMNVTIGIDKTLEKLLRSNLAKLFYSLIAFLGISFAFFSSSLGSSTRA